MDAWEQLRKIARDLRSDADNTARRIEAEAWRLEVDAKGRGPKVPPIEHVKERA